MTPHALRPVTVLTAVAALLACGEAPPDEPSGPVRSSIATYDRVITTESGLLGGTRDIAVAPDGRLFVSDMVNNHLLSVAPDGSGADTIGRSGQGPGEFRTPRALHVDDDTVRVYDLNNSRIQFFDRAGTLARQVAVPVGRTGLHSALDSRGRLGVGVTVDSALAVVMDDDTGPLRFVGDPYPSTTPIVDLPRMKEQARAGEIPDVIVNHTFLAWGADGSTYLAFRSVPEVRRHGPDGALRWRATLDDPLLSEAHRRYVRRNTDDEGFFRIDYVTDAHEVGGDLWVLLNPGDSGEGAMLVLNGEDGSVRRRIALGGLTSAGPFAFDTMRGRLYVVMPDEAAVVAYTLEG